MNVWTKVMIGLVLVASMALFVLATRTLRTHQVWMTAGQSYDKKIEDAKKAGELAMDGDERATPPVPGIRQLSIDLHALLVDRGRVWRQCRPENIDPQTGNVTVGVDVPDPHGIKDKTIICIFEERQGGRYLGEFKVTGLGEKKVQLAPTMKLLPRQLAQLLEVGKVGGTWTLCDRMPVDRHGVFQNYTLEQLQALMPDAPPESLNEYLRDGKPAEANDPPNQVEDGKYVRQLNDYEVLFHELHQQIAAWTDRRDAAATDKAIAEKTRDEIQQEIKRRQDEIDNRLKPDLAKVGGEVAVITDHQRALEARHEFVRAEIKRLLDENRKLAERLKRDQFRAAERLNELIRQEKAEGNAGNERSGARIPPGVGGGGRPVGQKS